MLRAAVPSLEASLQLRYDGRRGAPLLGQLSADGAAVVVAPTALLDQPRNNQSQSTFTRRKSAGVKEKESTRESSRACESACAREGER